MQEIIKMQKHTNRQINQKFIYFLLTLMSLQTTDIQSSVEEEKFWKMYFFIQWKSMGSKTK